MNYVHRASAFLLGPGLGFNISTKKFVEEVISKIEIPTVIDADGLRHVEQIPDWHKKLNKLAVLTPHVGDANTTIPEFKTFLCDVRRA